jgi:hypothetical protein
MCNCEIINGSRYVCDACRKASQQLLNEHIAAYHRQSMQTAADDALYNECMRDVCAPLPRIDLAEYIKLIKAGSDRV